MKRKLIAIAIALSAILPAIASAQMNGNNYNQPGFGSCNVYAIAGMYWQDDTNFYQETPPSGVPGNANGYVPNYSLLFLAADGSVQNPYSGQFVSISSGTPGTFNSGTSSTPVGAWSCQDSGHVLVTIINQNLSGSDVGSLYPYYNVRGTTLWTLGKLDSQGHVSGLTSSPTESISLVIPLSYNPFNVTNVSSIKGVQIFTPPPANSGAYSYTRLEQIFNQDLNPQNFKLPACTDISNCGYN